MKDPAFLFYSDNFLSGTMFFTDEQVGKYIRLLCAQHLTGHLRENHMIFICKSYDKDIWEKFKKDDDGLYFNERLDDEISKRRKYSESRANNKKGKIKDHKNTSKSYEKHMGNENENGNMDLTYSLNIDFEFFWNEYDKKVGNKEKLRKKWESLTDKERQDIISYIPLYKQSRPDKQFRKDPSTFLNNKSWNDEIIQYNGQTFKTTTGAKLTGTQKAAEKLAGEVAEKGKRFAENMQNT